MTQDPTERFSTRVDDYVRYRPRYPSALTEVIREETGLDRDWVVADIGSGTGFSAEPFLANGNVVAAVEPNAEMRRAAEVQWIEHDHFRSVAGSAEATGLDDGSVDLVVAGQAFHWFDTRRARAEFERILRGPKWTAFFWNTRLLTGGPFEERYEALLERFGTDYATVRHDRVDGRELTRFLGRRVTRRVIPHEQILSYEELEGRLRSSSYTPPPGDPTYEPMLEALRSLFEAVRKDGVVRMRYDTEIFTGNLT